MSLSQYKLRPLPRPEPAAALTLAPGSTPGVVDPMPVLWPAGPTPHGFLYGQLQNLNSLATTAVLRAGDTMTGALGIHMADNSTFLQFADTTPLGGVHILDAGPYHNLRFSGPNGDPPARHQFSLWDKAMPSNTYGVDASLGWNTFTVDADGQVHIQPKVRHTGDTGGSYNTTNHMLRLNAWVDGQPAVGFGDGIEWFAQRLDGAGVNQVLMQSYWNALTADGSGDSAVLEIWNLQSGTMRRACQFNSNGSLDIQDQQRLSVLTVPTATSAHGTLCIGDGGFGGGTGGFNGSSSGTYLSMDAPSGAAANLIDAQVAGLTRLQVSSDGICRHHVYDTATAAVSFPLRLRHFLTTGTPAVGIGTGLQLFAPDSAGTQVTVGQLYSFVLTNTPGAVSANMVFQSLNAGALATSLVLDHNGNSLVQGKLGVGNRVARTTLTSPGTVTGMVEVLDASGNSLGGFPLYSLTSFS